ncbi:MAG: hypothetical protein VX112_01885 [Pseudomonadota bacterium]|nr:hypothetical protein [Pseudomonadota bacterium]
MRPITDQYNGIAIMFSERHRLTGTELAKLSRRIKALQSQIRTIKKRLPDLSSASEFSSEWDGTNAGYLETIDRIMTNLQEKQQAVSKIQSSLPEEQQQVSKNRSSLPSKHSSTIKGCFETQAKNRGEIASRESEIRGTHRTKVLSSTKKPLQRQPGE